MFKKFAFKPVSLIILLAVPLLFANASTGHAGGPQPGPKESGIEFVGHAVDGLLNAVIVDLNPDDAIEDLSVVQYIVVICKEAQVVLGPKFDEYSTPQDLPDTTAECLDDSDLCLEGFMFPDVINSFDSPLLDCFPEARPLEIDDLFITKVKNFVNTRTAISAEVTLRLGQFVGDGNQ
jgi:hypothetical protein